MNAVEAETKISDEERIKQFLIAHDPNVALVPVEELAESLEYCRAQALYPEEYVVFTDHLVARDGFDRLVLEKHKVLFHSANWQKISAFLDSQPMEEWPTTHVTFNETYATV